jgi:hypothetical protein
VIESLVSGWRCYGELSVGRPPAGPLTTRMQREGGTRASLEREPLSRERENKKITYNNKFVFYIMVFNFSYFIIKEFKCQII